MDDQLLASPSEAVSSETVPKHRGMTKKIASFLGFKGIVIAFVLLFVGIFCLQNIESTSVQFLFWKLIEVPKLYLVLISLFLGAALGFLIGWHFFKNNSNEISSEKYLTLNS